MKYALILFALIALIATSFFCGMRKERQRIGNMEVTSDTVFIERIDTIRIKDPVAKSSKRVGTIAVPAGDLVATLSKSDSNTITIPREQVYYEDSTYRAWVSGYNPKLDSIRIVQRNIERTITERIRDPTPSRRGVPRWGLGIHIGYGLTGTVLAPYIGIGISYNIITF